MIDKELLQERTARLMTMLEDRYNTRCSDGQRLVQVLNIGKTSPVLWTNLHDFQAGKCTYQTAMDNYRKVWKDEREQALRELGRILLDDFRLYFLDKSTGLLDWPLLTEAFVMIGNGFENPWNPKRIHRIDSSDQNPMASEQVLGQFRGWYSVKRALSLIDSAENRASWERMLPLIGIATEIAIKSKGGTQTVVSSLVVQQWNTLNNLADADLRLYSIR